MLKITSNHLAPLKTRDIPTLTNPHLHFSNNGYNPPSPPVLCFQWVGLLLKTFPETSSKSVFRKRGNLVAGTFSIYQYCKTNSGWRYCKAAFRSNGKIKPNVVIASGVEEKHTEGRYFLNFNGQWIDAGVGALEAQRRRQLRLNQIEYERLSRRSSVTATAERPSPVEFSGPKVIKDEVEAYLADLELTRRPARTVQSKRKYLGDFIGLIGKGFADEYRREDVLKYKNKLQDEGFAPKTIDTRMMALVTFFNRWLKIKLGLDAKNWPETHDSDPEPYTDGEAAKLEAASVGEINLLIRTFRQTGCRDMELAHLNDTDLLDSKEIYIREKPCSDCKALGRN